MKNEIDFINGNTVKSLLKMVIPLVLAMLLTMAYNLVDSLWVGNLMGEEAYAALTSSTAVVLILSAIAMGSSNGAAIIISQKVGEQNKADAEKVISTMLLMSIIFSAVTAFVLEAFLKPLLRAMSVPQELFDMAYSYLSIYLIGYAAIFLYMHFTAVFRAFGDPIFQMKGMLISTVFNAVVDPIMIRLIGLNGAAWATVAAEVLCLVFSVIYYKRKKLFRLGIKKCSREFVMPILKDSVPSAVQSCMPAISSAVMLMLVTGFGITAVAAYGVTNRLEILLFYPAMAMNMAVTAIAGQCAGANRFDRLSDYVKAAAVCGGVFTAVISAAVIIFSRQLCGFFINSTSAAKIVHSFFAIISVGYVMYMLTSCFLGVISGVGKPSVSMLLMFVYYIVIRVPLAAAMVHIGFGMNGIWTAILISHIAAAILAAAEYAMVLRKKHVLLAV